MISSARVAPNTITALLSTSPRSATISASNVSIPTSNSQLKKDRVDIVGFPLPQPFNDGFSMLINLTMSTDGKWLVRGAKIDSLFEITEPASERDLDAVSNVLASAVARILDVDGSSPEIAIDPSQDRPLIDVAAAIVRISNGEVMFGLSSPWEQTGFVASKQKAIAAFNTDDFFDLQDWLASRGVVPRIDGVEINGGSGRRL